MVARTVNFGRRRASRSCTLRQNDQMPRLTRIYTKTGDAGTTGLGGGKRVPKDSPRVEAYGTVDELVTKCQGLRSRFGITYVLILGDIEAFAPVVKRLAA